MNGQAICRSPNKRAKGPKTWLLRWDAGVGPDGKRRRPSETFKGTKEEADARLRSILATVDKGTNVAPSKATVEQWVDQWVKHIAAHVTTATLEGYTHWLKSRAVPSLGSIVLQRVRRADVNALYTSLLTADPAVGKKALSAQSVQHVHRALFECFEHAKEEGVIATNPCAGAKRSAVPDAPQVVLNQERMAAFLQGLAPRQATAEEKARRRWRMTDANRLFLYWMATLAACTGMRRGEILALRWSDVDLEAGVIHVQRALTQTRTFGIGVKLPKTNRGRAVNIPTQLCTMLVQYRKDQKEMWLLLGARPKADEDALLLPGSPELPDEPCKPNLASKRFSAYVASVGLQGLKLHGLRHSHASQLLALGYGVADIAKTLGHSSPATTMKIYAHALEGAQPRMAAEMGLMLDRATVSI